MSISGDTLVVGADFEDSSATGVNGDQTSNDASNSGAVYVFERSGSTWSQQAYLKASNTETNDLFGGSVSVSGDTIVVGAQLEDSGAMGVNGIQVSNAVPDSGAAYVFVRSGTTWSQEAYLKATNTGRGDAFGNSVSVSGDTLIVGAWLEDSSATGIDGDQASNAATDSGAAYLFDRSGPSWSQRSYIKASNTDAVDCFGRSVGVSGDTVVVSAFLEDSGATGVNGDQSSNLAVDSGAAYVFVRSGNNWAQEAYIKASNSGFADQFGIAASVCGESIVVGAITEDSSARGINGDQSNNLAIDSGAAYVYARFGTTWTQVAYVKASNTGASDLFGWSIGVSGELAVAGARWESSNATGVNGNQANNLAPSSGAAYVFDLIAPGTIGTSFCHPLVQNSSGTDATITATGSTVVLDNDVTLIVDGLPLAGTTALLFNSMSASTTINIPGGGAGTPSLGRICIGGGHFGRHVNGVYSGTAGTFAVLLDLGALPFPEGPGDYSIAVIAGQTWFWQCWYRDGIGGPSNFSDAVGLRFE